MHLLGDRQSNHQSSFRLTAFLNWVLQCIPCLFSLTPQRAACLSSVFISRARLSIRLFFSYRTYWTSFFGMFDNLSHSQISVLSFLCLFTPVVFVTPTALLSLALLVLPLVVHWNTSFRICWLFVLTFLLVFHYRLLTLAPPSRPKSSSKATLPTIRKAIIWHGVPNFSISYCRTSSIWLRELHLLLTGLEELHFSAFWIITVSFSRAEKTVLSSFTSSDGIRRTKRLFLAKLDFVFDLSRAFTSLKSFFNLALFLAWSSFPTILSYRTGKKRKIIWSTNDTCKCRKRLFHSLKIILLTAAVKDQR